MLTLPNHEGPNMRKEAGATAEPAMQAALLLAEPLYKQVKNQLVRSLAQGEWKPGEMLPSEQKLAERYGVGISTVRAAIGQLAAAKILARKQGKGTFVSLQDERRNIYQFFHVVRNDGVKELPVSELLSFRKARADHHTADLLQLPRTAHGADVFKLSNVLRVAGVPVVLSDITIPCALFPGLNEKTLREGGATLYAVYQTHFGVNIVRSSEQLRAVRTTAEDAAVLALEPEEPMLEVQRVAYTFNDAPVEVRRSRVNTRNYFYLFDQGVPGT